MEILSHFRTIEELTKSASFLIPSDIEQRLIQGSANRYNIQYNKFHTLRCTDTRLQSLIGLIMNYHKCYDQEGYIIK